MIKSSMFCKFSNLVSFARLRLVFAWNSTSAAFQMELKSADDVIFSDMTFSAMARQRFCECICEENDILEIQSQRRAGRRATNASGWMLFDS
jgi:hypothetical protein